MPSLTSLTSPSVRPLVGEMNLDSFMIHVSPAHPEKGEARMNCTHTERSQGHLSRDGLWRTWEEGLDIERDTCTYEGDSRCGKAVVRCTAHQHPVSFPEDGTRSVMHWKGAAMVHGHTQPLPENASYGHGCRVQTSEWKRLTRRAARLCECLLGEQANYGTAEVDELGRNKVHKSRLP